MLQMIFSFLLGEKEKDNVDSDKSKTTKEEAKDIVPNRFRNCY